MAAAPTMQPRARRPRNLPVRRARGVRRGRWAAALLPTVVVLGIFFGYPLYEMFRLSLTDFLSPSDRGLANYSWFFESDVQMRILRRTLTSALLTTALCLGIGYPYAYMMTVVRSRTRLIMLAAVLMPVWTSMIVRTFSWVVLLQDSGPVVSLLGKLGFRDVQIIGTTTAVVIGMTQVMLPFMVLALYSSLTRIDRSLLTAAQSLGAPPHVAFARVYVPLSVPGIMAGGTIVFILSLGFYFTPALLGSSRNSMLSQQIVEQVTSLLAFGRGGAMAFTLLAITILILGVASLVARPFTRAIGAEEHQQ